MSTFFFVVRELVGLLIDDGSLAIAIVVVVALAAVSAAVGGPPLVTGGILFAGIPEKLTSIGEENGIGM
jgi:hypothetical protein